MNRITVFFAILFLMTVPVYAAEPIKIGYINSYTGLPHFLERGNRAAEMLVEEVNAGGGIKGRPVELLIRDDRVQVGDAITIAEDLINRDEVVALAGLSFAHIALAISQVAEQYKTPYFAGWCAPIKCVEAGGDYMFSIEEYVEDSGKKLARLAAKKPAKRWAVVGYPIEWTLSLSKSFKAELKSLKPDVTFADDQLYTFGKAEGGLVVQALRAAGVEGVMNGLAGKDLVSYMRAAESRGFIEGKPHISSYLAPEDLNFMGAEAPAGWIAMGYPEHYLGLPALDEFIAKYEARYEGQNPGISGLIAYINLTFLLKSLETAESLSGEDIAKAALTAEIETPVGPMSYDPETRRANFSYWYGEIALDGEKPYLKVKE